MISLHCMMITVNHSVTWARRNRMFWPILIAHGQRIIALTNGLLTVSDILRFRQTLTVTLPLVFQSHTFRCVVTRFNNVMIRFQPRIQTDKKSIDISVKYKRISKEITWFQNGFVFTASNGKNEILFTNERENRQVSALIRCCWRCYGTISCHYIGLTKPSSFSL
jgi:hypothetical protein